MKGSWRTTALGICVLVGAICAAAKALLDGDPSTTVNMEQILSALAGVGLMNARDDKVSSEDASAK